MKEKKSKAPKPVVIDFETFGIEDRPRYPPLPVGVSIQHPGTQPRYYAFGHVEGNNCFWGDAVEAVRQAYLWPDGVVFQNGKFDVDVAEVHFDLPIPHWTLVHDTLFLLFLDDPHQVELGLKPASERLLDMPPEEQDEVRDWLLEHQPIKGIKISKSKNSDHYFGRYISLAPGEIVGKYANGDVDRTGKLFKLLYKSIVARGMLPAYNRERELMPILLEMERQGLPVDHKRLTKDVEFYNQWRDKIIAWVKKRIKAPDDINLDSGAQLVDAMIKSGRADPNLIPLTPTGKYQTNKDALLLGVTDKVLLGVLKYLSQLNTCLNTFMQNWLRTADASGGLIYTTWNQTKTPSGDSNVGTRTGRLSSTPNFQNIPKVFVAIFHHQDKKKNLPKSPWPDLPELPNVRSYITPFEGEIFIDRDYSQQEPRILAHFDGGSLMQKYVDQPWIDFHDFAKAELEKMGKFYDRKPVKNTNLGLIYGMGVGKLAIRNDMSVDEAGELKNAIMTLYPGLKEMYGDMKYRMKNDIPIHTWGGREYYCEPSRMINGRMVTFDYKMVNVLIQGSAADCTKEAIIRFNRKKKELNKPGWKLVLNVHDQLTVSVINKRTEWIHAMAVLQHCMESVEFSVPMLSEGAISSTNWAELKDYDKKGIVL